MDIKAWLKRPATVAFLVFTGVYAIALGMIFWGAWSLDKAPVAPDCATEYAVNDASAWFQGVLAGGSFIPSDLMHVLGGMYFWQELQFALAAWLAALGVAYYLRGRGLSLLASYGGGAAFGLMGYCFTLFSAGHLGWFIWMMYGPFAFGLTDRCVRLGGWRRWLMLGAVLAWASARQPDLWLLFTVLTAAYGAWCLVRERRVLAWGRLGVGLGICALMALAVGMPQFGHAIFHDIAGRESQIGASGTGDAAEQGKSEAAGKVVENPAEKARKAQERWLFCTSWSLPPEDTLEFAVAEVHGGSNDPRVFQKPGNAQYRGRLGQHGVVPAGAGGRHPITGETLKPGDEYWMPYRQHSLYFGLLSLVFAAAGAWGWWRLGRGPAKAGRSDNEAAGSALANLADNEAAKPSEGSALADLADNEAAKPSERSALANLADNEAAKPSERSALADLADWRDVPFWLGAALVVYLCALGGFTPFYRLVYALPFGDMMRCPVKFVHLLEFCVAVLAGFGLDFLRTRLAGKGSWVVPVLAVLAAVNVFDLARVDARYLAVQDVSFGRAPNEAADTVRELGGGKVFVAMPTQEGGEMVKGSLGLHLAETAASESEEGVRFLLASGSAFQADKTIEERLRSGALKIAGFYSISRVGGVKRTEQRGATLLLLQKTAVPAPGPKSAPPPARGPQALALLSLFATTCACGLLLVKYSSKGQKAPIAATR